MAQIEKIVQLRLRKIEFDLVKRFERIAEVNENQIALVAELGKERSLNRRIRICFFGTGALQTLKRGGGFRNNLFLFAGRAGPPSLPIEAKKLVEQE